MTDSNMSVSRSMEQRPTNAIEDRKSSINVGYDQDRDSEKEGVVHDGQQMTSKRYKYDRGDPFGDESDADTKYRTLSWLQTGVIMAAETISIGMLTLPSAFANLGMVPGLFLLIGLGLVATYTGFVLGQFKEVYPHCHNLADVGEVLMGPIGRELFGAIQTILLIFLMASHTLTFIIALNAITDHATCTIVWGVVGTAVFIILSLPRTLRRVSYLALISFMSILSSVIITMIAIGIEKPNPGIQAYKTVGFVSAYRSTSNIIFAYSGHIAFFSFISEMKKPKDFPKALALLQVLDISIYVVVAVVIYYYGGEHVASPALSSTSPIVRKVAYGIALPSIIISGVIYANVAGKYVYVRLFRGTGLMQKRSIKSVGIWVGLMMTFWVVAWIVAESIPLFNDLLSIISALFVSWFGYGISGFLWLYINKGQYFKNWKKGTLTVINLVIFGMGGAMCGIGLYASGTAIHRDVGRGHSWSCSATKF